jgi:hypothetical protein
VRFYDAEVGRFTQRDPLALDIIADTVYANDNPIGNVDPDGLKCRKFGKSPTIQNCWNRLSKCVGKCPFFKRARHRLSDDVWMCDGNGSGLFRGPRFGESDCWERNGQWHCRMWLYQDKFFDETYQLCETFLHELVHIGNWPSSNASAEQDVENASGYLWFYLCDPKTKCNKLPPDWHGTIGKWVR